MASLDTTWTISRERAINLGSGAKPASGDISRAADRYVPLYEAKMGDFFDHRAAGYDDQATFADTVCS